MKLLLKVNFILFSLLIFGCGKTAKVSPIITEEYPESFQVEVSNPLNGYRKDETIQLDIKTITDKHPDFNPKAFIVFRDTTELPSQTEDIDGDNVPDRILFLTNLNPMENQNIMVRYAKDGVKKREYKKRTQAVLGEKVDYTLVKGEYTKGRFENVKSSKMPADHVAHDALYRIEGPGWESELITYRYYLDARNRNDLFGKKKHELILQKVGVNDLVSNSQESYTKMLDWGMDIFKVGESLGIGSIGMWSNDKVVTVSTTDSVIAAIATNGPIRSDVYTKYYGWLVGKNKYNLFSNLSISAGSRLTHSSLILNGNNVEMCTGLAKHPDTEYFKSENEIGWNYIALYGKQSLSGDNLGISVFYKYSDLIKLTDDKNSYVVVLKPTNGKLDYYFAGAWQAEPDGIKNKEEFQKFLDNTIKHLNYTVSVNLK